MAEYLKKAASKARSFSALDILFTTILVGALVLGYLGTADQTALMDKYKHTGIYGNSDLAHRIDRDFDDLQDFNSIGADGLEGLDEPLDHSKPLTRT